MSTMNAASDSLARPDDEHRSRAADARASPNDALFASLYGELHRLAAAMARAGPGAVVSATTLLHEAYRTSSSAMRWPLSTAAISSPMLHARCARRSSTRARAGAAQKRGGGLDITSIDTGRSPRRSPSREAVQIGARSTSSPSVEPELANVVDLSSSAASASPRSRRCKASPSAPSSEVERRGRCCSGHSPGRDARVAHGAAESPSRKPWRRNPRTSARRRRRSGCARRASPSASTSTTYVEHGGTAESARQLGVDEHAVVKTLVMQDEKGEPLIVLMHGDRQVSTKNLARAIGAKSVEPCKPEVARAAQRLSGRRHVAVRRPGGRCRCSSRRRSSSSPRICINGGRRGYLVGIAPSVLTEQLGAAGRLRDLRRRPAGEVDARRRTPTAHDDALDIGHGCEPC